MLPKMLWILYTLLNVLFGSMRNVTKKNFLNKGEKASEYLSIRCLFVVLMLLFFIPWFDFSISYNKYIYSSISGIIFAFGSIYSNRALQEMEISHFSPLKNLNLIFVTLLGIIVLNEQLTLLQIGGMTLLLTGVYALEIDKEHHLLKPFKEFISSPVMKEMTLGIIIISVVIIVDRIILDYVKTPLFNHFFIVWVSMTLTLIVFDTIEYGFKELKDITKKHWKNILLPAVLTLLMMAAYYKAISLAYAAIVLALVKLKSFITLVIGGIFFKETNLKEKALESIIIIAGAVIVVLA